jgi:NMD protein affecting ribosome stability and mRNA decay
MSKQPPSRIRRNVEDYDDPYIDDESLPENTVCKKCGAVYTADRWYLKGQVPVDKVFHPVVCTIVCPACKKQAGRDPGGIVKLSGRFLREHSGEIMNLIRNENAKAQATNPLERIMDMQSVGDELLITTTNEKLAQRIGRAVHKAYRGEIDYQFGEDNKQARVNWRREA